MRKHPGGHLIYETGDKDAPEFIKDRNGAVVLSMCRKCRRCESQLVTPCDADRPGD